MGAPGEPERSSVRSATARVAGRRASRKHEPHVLQRRQLGPEVRALEDDRDLPRAVVRQLRLAEAGERAAEPTNLAGRGLVQPGGEVQRRALPRSRGAEQRDQLAGVDPKVEAAQRDGLRRPRPIDLEHVVELERAEARLRALGVRLAVEACHLDGLSAIERPTSALPTSGREALANGALSGAGAREQRTTVKHVDGPGDASVRCRTACRRRPDSRLNGKRVRRAGGGVPRPHPVLGPELRGPVPPRAFRPQSGALRHASAVRRRALVLGLGAAAAAGCSAALATSPTIQARTTASGTPAPEGVAATRTSAEAPPLTGDAGSAATGDIPDNQVFLVFHDAAAGYSIEYPEGWVQQGNGRRVVFRDKNNIAQLVVARGRLPRSGSVRRDLTSQTAVSVTAAPRRTTINGTPALKVVYHTQSAPNPVTGKRVALTVDRYYLAHRGRIAVIDLGTPIGVDNVDAYRLMIKSFRWM